MKLAVALIGLVLVGCGSNGKDGEPGKEGTGGKPGTNGTNGTSGKDGIDNKITSSISCHGDLSSFSSAQRTLNGKTISDSFSFYYTVVVTTSEDVFVSGEIIHPAYDASKTRFYSKQQAGALRAPVSIGWDVIENNSSGFWNLSLDRVTKIMTVRYTDSDFAMAPNYIELSFPAYACTNNL